MVRFLLQTYLERDVRAVTAVKDLATFRAISCVAGEPAWPYVEQDGSGRAHRRQRTDDDSMAWGARDDRADPHCCAALRESRQAPHQVAEGVFRGSAPRVPSAGHRLGGGSGQITVRGSLFEGFIASEIKAQVNAGRRRELYYFRDQQGLEVDFVVPGRGGSLALVECTNTRTVTPAMAAPMQRLAEAVRKKRPKKTEVTSTLVHEASRAGICTQAVAPGVRALAQCASHDLDQYGLIVAP